MLKIHIGWKEKEPDGTITRSGNEKTIAKKRIDTQAKLTTGRLEDLFIGIIGLNILHAAPWMIG